MASEGANLVVPSFFSALAAKYARHTGNSTRTIFASALGDLQRIAPITRDSVIHDNAAGPGTAASVIVEQWKDGRPGAAVPDMLITDNSPPMVAVAEDSFATWPNVVAKVADSVSLDDVRDASFTHSILNFSVFAVADPLAAVREMHRTLRPGGVAAILNWKHAGAGAVVHRGQLAVRPDLPVLKLPHPELSVEGGLVDLVVEAGFPRSGLSVSQRDHVVRGAELEGLREFMLSDLTAPGRATWTDEEKARWPDAVDEVLREEVEKQGGVKFEAWVLFAKKE